MLSFNGLLTFIGSFTDFKLAYERIEELFTIDCEKFNGNLSNDLSGAKTATQEIVGTVLDVVRIVGMGIALIMLTYIGIKFMLASPNERANIKQYSINYVIGAFILIAGVGLLTVVRDFALTIKAGT